MTAERSPEDLRRKAAEELEKKTKKIDLEETDTAVIEKTAQELKKRWETKDLSEQQILQKGTDFASYLEQKGGITIKEKELDYKMQLTKDGTMVIIQREKPAGKKGYEQISEPISGLPLDYHLDNPTDVKMLLTLAKKEVFE